MKVGYKDLQSLHPDRLKLFSIETGIMKSQYVLDSYELNACQSASLYQRTTMVESHQTKGFADHVQMSKSSSNDKSQRSIPLTSTSRSSNQSIIKLTKPYRFVGEESYSKGASRDYLIGNETTWCVDPLDGNISHFLFQDCTTRYTPFESQNSHYYH